VHTGTISDYDIDGQYGLIDADDGQFVLFNLRNVEPSLRGLFRVGRRVEFVEQKETVAPRALALTLLSSPDSAADSI
jgi:cold shock CspA family protein